MNCLQAEWASSNPTENLFGFSFSFSVGCLPLPVHHVCMPAGAELMEEHAGDAHCGCSTDP